ncbi:hypothetical protein WJX74_006582 [Apatococcus lobatus]|uniref:Non-haem dioxygenase N-terminal domain-containing protein n=1 Tax=Apatococcus lobatus TaxID=904363 RepID=A0AAW1RZW8_9CHLO
MSPSLISNGYCSPARVEELPCAAISELNSRLVVPDNAERDILSDSCPLPTIDLSPFLAQRFEAPNSAVQELCRRVADCLSSTGCVVIKDPRVASEDNSHFVDLMERYFSQAAGVKHQDARPELHYQVGVTPEGVEEPRCIVDPACLETIKDQPPGHRATVPTGPDPKWRFMWRLGARPDVTEFQELNAAPVLPAGFPEWKSVMECWGSKMLDTLTSAAEMAAIGFGLDRHAITNVMHLGPHLLAPTGADLSQHSMLGSCYAGFHYDLNLLTIHGKSRFPGLFVWLRDGRRIPVRIPDGCLFIQAGKQLEYLTAGHVLAGMHEVICTEGTQAAVKAARAAGRSTWRISSTVFGHVQSDQILQPLGHFAKAPTAAKYAPVAAGTFVQHELEAINLKKA